MKTITFFIVLRFEPWSPMISVPLHWPLGYVGHTLGADMTLLVFLITDQFKSYVKLSLKICLQVFCQPIFAFVEGWSKQKWPESKFITREYMINLSPLGLFPFSFYRLVWRTAYVILTTILAMLFPFFNDFVGLLGAASFWPLTVYFPIQMYIAQARIPKYSFTWIWLKILSLVCLIISLLAAAGSVQGLIKSLQKFQLFKSESWSSCG